MPMGEEEFLIDFIEITDCRMNVLRGTREKFFCPADSLKLEGFLSVKYISLKLLQDIPKVHS